jgi:hypothetical protein
MFVLYLVAPNKLTDEGDALFRHGGPVGAAAVVFGHAEKGSWRRWARPMGTDQMEAAQRFVALRPGLRLDVVRVEVVGA